MMDICIYTGQVSSTPQILSFCRNWCIGDLFYYLYQYELSSCEINGGYLHIGILQGPGESLLFVSVELSTNMWFYPVWRLPMCISAITCTLPFKFAVQLHIYIAYKTQVSLWYYLLSLWSYQWTYDFIQFGGCLYVSPSPFCELTHL